MVIIITCHRMYIVTMEFTYRIKLHYTLLSYIIMTCTLYTSQYISILVINRKTTLQILKVFPNVVPQCTNHITFEPVRMYNNVRKDYKLNK